MRRHFGTLARSDRPYYEKVASKFGSKLREAFPLGGLVQDFPTVFVSTAAHAAIGRDATRVFRECDFHDISHAALALPYCDCFATERP